MCFHLFWELLNIKSSYFGDQSYFSKCGVHSPCVCVISNFLFYFSLLALCLVIRKCSECVRKFGECLKKSAYDLIYDLVWIKLHVLMTAVWSPDAGVIDNCLTQSQYSLGISLLKCSKLYIDQRCWTPSVILRWSIFLPLGLMGLFGKLVTSTLHRHRYMSLYLSELIRWTLFNGLCFFSFFFWHRS